MSEQEKPKPKTQQKLKINGSFEDAVQAIFKPIPKEVKKK